MKIILSLITCLLSLITYHLLLVTSANAEEQCLDDLYYWDSNVSKCIHKSGGYFDQDLNECAYAFEVVDQTFCSPTLTPSPTATPTRTPSPTPAAMGSEEKAVNVLKTGLLPKIITDEPEEQSLLEKIQNFLNPGNLLGFLINPSLIFPERFYSQSDSLSTATIAKQVIEEDNDFLDNLKGFLGGSTGVYGVNLPKIEGVEDTIKGSEVMYEKSYFPEGIKPITER